MTVPRRRSKRFRWEIPLLGVLVALLAGPAAEALTAPPEVAALAELDDEEIRALETLALYDEDTRDAALRVARHAGILVDVELIQARSSEAFEGVVGPREREDQEAIWEVSREPGLLRALVDGGPKSRRELEAIAARRPEAARAAVLRVGDDHELLSELLDIQDQAGAEFDALIEPLSSRDRAAFRELIDRPELTSLLARHVSLTVRLGDADRREPEATRELLAALAADVARENREAGEDWTRSLEEDPKARDDLERSARAYAAEYDYEYEELTAPRVVTVVETTVHPYPYWFGYPAWYAAPALYPYGYWYPAAPHLGFYHASGHRAVYFGLPSPHFLHWFFALERHRHYGHLTHHFEGHHHRHRAARGHHHRTLARWRHAKAHGRHHRVERARHRPIRHARRHHEGRSFQRNERHVDRQRGHRDRDGFERRDRGQDRTDVRRTVRVERRSERNARRGKHVERRRTERRKRVVEKRSSPRGAWQQRLDDLRPQPKARTPRPERSSSIRKATHANRFQRAGERIRAERRAQAEAQQPKRQRVSKQEPQRQRVSKQTPKRQRVSKQAPKRERVAKPTSRRVRSERSDGGRRGGKQRAHRGGRGSGGKQSAGFRRR